MILLLRAPALLVDVIMLSVDGSSGAYGWLVYSLIFPLYVKIFGARPKRHRQGSDCQGSCSNGEEQTPAFYR